MRRIQEIAAVAVVLTFGGAIMTFVVAAAAEGLQRQAAIDAEVARYHQRYNTCLRDLAEYGGDVRTFCKEHASRK